MSESVLEVPVRSVGLDDLLASYSHGLLMFHNLDTLYKVGRDEQFRSACQSAEVAVIDGQILRVLLSVLWAQPTQKVSGSDFLPAFCTHHARDESVTVFLLGAGPGVAESAMRSLNAKAGREVVVGAHSPSYDLLTDPTESRDVVSMINASGATVLAVGLGAPKQELWMTRHRASLTHVSRFMAVGATLDFEAGRIRRAPAWMSRAGLEWLFRLGAEPRRLWRRYLIQGPYVISRMSVSRLRGSTGRLGRPHLEEMP